MASGRYAAIIRTRIKRRLRIRVGTNWTLRIQGGILLLPPLLSTPDSSEREGGFASHPHPGTYATSKQNVQFLIYGLNFSAAEIQCAHALVLM